MPSTTASGNTVIKDCAPTPGSRLPLSVRLNTPCLTCASLDIKSGVTSVQFSFKRSSELADITVAVSVPVDGLKNNLVLETLAALIEPEVAVVNVT